MNNAFANAKQHANDMFRQSQALDDGIYGAFPDYTDRPFEWERRMRMIMASTLKHNGILSGFTQDNLLKSTLEQAETGEVIGNRRLTMRIFGRVCRDYAKRKKADANELMIERGEVFEYGKSIGLTEAEISSVIVKTHHGNDYVKRCKIGLDWYLKMHPRETPEARTTIVIESENAFEEMLGNDMLTADDPSPAEIIAAQNAQSRAEFAAITADREDTVSFNSLEDMQDNDSALAQYEAESSAALHRQLNATAAQQEQDELTQDKWKSFWISIRNQIGDLPITDQRNYVHRLFDVHSVKVLIEQGKSKGDLLMTTKKHFDGIRDGSTKMLTKNAPESPVSEPSATPIATPPSNAPEAASVSVEKLNETVHPQSEKDMQNEGCVTTNVVINNLELKVTVWAGQSPESVASNILCALDGLRKAIADDKVKSFASVMDGRDTLTIIKRDGQILSEPVTQRMGMQSTQPQNITPISDAPSAQQSGTTDCFMIKVGKTFKRDKDQIVFECNGLDDVKYSSKDIAALVKITSGLRKTDGAAIMASDLFEGAKVPVRGKVNWKKSDDGKFTNVMGTEAA